MIDAHLHAWDPGRLRYPWLDKHPDLDRRLIPDAVELSRAGVRGAVFVEAGSIPEQAIAEAQWAVQLRETAGIPVVGVVAWAPLGTGKVADWLDRLAEIPAIVGIRSDIHGVLDDWGESPLLRKDLHEAARAGLVVDVNVEPAQLSVVERLASDHPSLRIVLEHGGNPLNGDAESMQHWSSSVRLIAQHDNVTVKLSGSVVAVNAPVNSDGKAAPAILLNAFSPMRCMIGSDWPVTGRAAPGTYLSAALSAVDHLVLSVGERQDVLETTAESVYGLVLP